MSWEDDSRERKKCFCGEGEIEIIRRFDDWGRSEEERHILCDKCRIEYIYDDTIIHGHPGNFVERGWVKKSVLEAEHKKKEEELKLKEIETNAFKFKYYDLWIDRLKYCKNKSELWKLLTQDGQYYPTLNQFYKSTRGFDIQKTVEYAGRYCIPSEKRRVFTILQLSEK